MFKVYSKVIQLNLYMYLGFPLGSVVKESPCNEGDLDSMPGLGRYAQRDMMSLSSILFGESHGERSLAGYSP